MNIPFRFPIKRSKGSKATEYYLTADKFNEYLESYPGMNLEPHFRQMRQWCIDNPSKRKTESGMPRFINTWLSKEYKKLKPYSTRGRTLEEDLTDRSWAN